MALPLPALAVVLRRLRCVHAYNRRNEDESTADDVEEYPEEEEFVFFNEAEPSDPSPAWSDSTDCNTLLRGVEFAESGVYADMLGSTAVSLVRTAEHCERAIQQLRDDLKRSGFPVLGLEYVERRFLCLRKFTQLLQCGVETQKGQTEPTKTRIDSPTGFGFSRCRVPGRFSRSKVMCNGTFTICS